MSAEHASLDVLYVGGKSAQQVGGKSAQFEHWNKVPDSVLFDGRISFAARCVYAALAGSAHGGITATIGQRRLAGLLGAHKETVLLAIRELERVGHIGSIGSGKVRRVYRLLAGGPTGSKPVAAPANPGSTREQSRGKATVTCPTCHKPCYGLLRVGWCRSCNWKLKIRGVVREEVHEALLKAG